MTDGMTQTQRRRMGLTLIFSGLIPWLALMFYIVYVRTPHVGIVVLTALCWGVFFVGKTMLKTKDPRPHAGRQ